MVSANRMKTKVAKELEKVRPSKLVYNYKLDNGRVVPLLLIDEPIIILFSFQKVNPGTSAIKLKEYFGWLRSTVRAFKETVELEPVNPVNPLIYPALVVPDIVESELQTFNKELKPKKYAEIPVNVISYKKVKEYVKSLYI